jgi:hypothetical protein
LATPSSSRHDQRDHIRRVSGREGFGGNGVSLGSCQHPQAFFVGVIQHQGGIRLLLLLHEPESGPGDRFNLAVGDLVIEAFQVLENFLIVVLLHRGSVPWAPCCREDGYRYRGPRMRT